MKFDIGVRENERCKKAGAGGRPAPAGVMDSKFDNLAGKQAVVEDGLHLVHTCRQRGQIEDDLSRSR